MRDAILRKARESAEVKLRFFEEQAEPLAACARALAGRFRAGGRLLAFGNGGSACDAEHAAVEFVHPIVEKRRPLPALALTSSTPALTAIGNDADFSQIFVDQLAIQARPGDAALGISTSGASSNVNRALRRARELGLLTIGFAGRDGGRMPDLCDHLFVVRTWSIHRVQETHTLLLHLLWDEVHLALGEDDVL
ncbi:D-sedoheptulose-7-phosphate isomerase [Anaeromyxobacter paludicola]|uniref:Phosphoheptose isomerase n=1 Tax=Anaeromyxobacter paludicola TaxID=2918171 RepID=A0ABM7X7X4_9BACT|nr:SIS domain-containing protein [Anaeromyxobacter paludicola]BDG07941.1 phosphoheptose isomerase [Anaeromyxobacter paludicola]